MTRSHSSRARLILLLLPLLAMIPAAGSGCDGPSDMCTVGQAACRGTRAGVCAAGLKCVGNICLVDTTKPAQPPDAGTPKQ